MSDIPLFTALATSTRQLYSLLKCIAFNNDAVVSIRPEGIGFTVEGSRIIQASTELDSKLFTTYILSDPDSEIPQFQINVAALLQALQIFGVYDASAAKNQNGGITSSFAAAFNTPALGVTGSCKITYQQEGAPLSIIIEEGGVKTNCELNTYRLPDFYDPSEETIPFDTDNILLKIVMTGFRLHDALMEIMSTDSNVLVVSASNRKAPYFALIGEDGPFGDSTVEFAPELQREGKSVARRIRPAATEAFSVAALKGMGGRVKDRYRMDLVKKAIRIMQIALKVALRMDQQGVLSLQFMMSQNKALGIAGSVYGDDAKVSFVEYRILPVWDDEDKHPGDSDDDGEMDENENGTMEAEHEAETQDQ